MPLIRPAGTFPRGKVTNNASPLRLRGPSVTYCKKSFSWDSLRAEGEAGERSETDEGIA